CERDDPPPHLAAYPLGLGILRDCSHRALRTRDHSRLPCSRLTRIRSRRVPDEPGVEADQERVGERVAAAEVMAWPGSGDPGEDAHWDGSSRPHRKDLCAGVFLYRVVPIDV